jgi:hypothetical protein
MPSKETKEITYDVAVACGFDPKKGKEEFRLLSFTGWELRDIVQGMVNDFTYERGKSLKSPFPKTPEEFVSDGTGDRLKSYAKRFK